jgi:hypothetical protein
LDVTSSSQDTDPPVLTDSDFNPKSVDVSTQAQVVTSTVAATDSGSGIAVVDFSFVSPSGLFARGCSAYSPSSGDRFSGTWSCNITIPQAAEAGTYSIQSIRITDAVSNYELYDAARLQALGFPTQLDVNYGGGSPGP